MTLLESLRALSSEKLEEIFKDSGKMKMNRIHSINWDSSTINKRDFFSYIPEEYRNEETDVIQFQIETSKGRVIGFFDSDHTFQVVLLDPAHNMQLSKYNEYTTVKTDELLNCYQKMVNKFAVIIAKSDNLKPEEFKKFIHELKIILADDGYCSKSRFVTIEKDLFDDLHDILQKKPDYLSLDLIIIEAIEMFKKSLEDN